MRSSSFFITLADFKVMWHCNEILKFSLYVDQAENSINMQTQVKSNRHLFSSHEVGSSVEKAQLHHSQAGGQVADIQPGCPHDGPEALPQGYPLLLLKSSSNFA